MTEKLQEIILRNAIKQWGERVQLEMLQEETTELSLAARKFIRQRTEDRLTDLIEEVADVEIMIAQVKIMFPLSTNDIDRVKHDKLLRLKRRILSEKFEG